MTLNFEGVVSEAPLARAEQLQSLLEGLEFGDERLSPRELEEVTRVVSARSDLFEDLVVNDGSPHWSLLLYQTPAYEIKVLAWRGDQPTDWHDHGGSSGAMSVAAGTLTERYRTTDSGNFLSRTYGPSDHGSFGPHHIHDVNFESGPTALSIHAYSPPLSGLTQYDRTRFGFVVREFIPEGSPRETSESSTELR